VVRFITAPLPSCKFATHKVRLILLREQETEELILQNCRCLKID